MPNASLRKLKSQKTHKERSQPSARRRFGLLEKHKDYVLRAKDFKNKKQRIKKLKEKAAFKNPDEFYYKMLSDKREGGPTHSNEELRLLKTQDVSYLMMKKVSEMRKVEKLQASLHNTGAFPVNKHKLFVDDEDELSTVAVSHVNDSEALRTKDVAEMKLRKVDKARQRSYEELGARKEREKQLALMASKLELQKHLLTKERKTKVQEADEGNPAVYKWARVRKT